MARPEARAACPGARRAAVERLEHALELVARDPGPAIDDTRRIRRRPAARARTRPAARRRGAWSSRARWRGPARAARRRRARAAGRGSIDVEAAGRPGEVVDGRADDLLDRVQSGVGSARAASRRERSSRLSMRRDSRALSWRSPASSRRSPSSMVGDRSGPTAARIAVSGERRSWLTARSSAVLTTSLRRRACVSMTSVRARRVQGGREHELSSAGSRAPAGARSAPRGPAGRTSVPSWRRPSRRGNTRRRSSASTGASSIDADGSCSARARRCAAARSDAARSSPPSSSRAISAERSASRRRAARPPRPCGRAPLGQRAGHGRGDEEDAEPDPVLAVGDREAAGRRQVEEVEGERADHRGEDPEQGAPTCRDQQHGEQVEHAGGDDRHELAQPVDRRR